MSGPQAIPVVRTGGIEVDRALAAVKGNIDRLTGQEKNATKLTALASTATLADVIAQVNILIARAGQ